MIKHRLLRTSWSASLPLLAALSLGIPAAAQNSTGAMGFPQPGAGPSTPGALAGMTSGPDPEQTHMLRKMVKERNMIRQQTIVDDTNRLLDLAKQLKDAVDKSNKDQLSLSVVNTAAEIEKLAKTVKEKMRDGQ